MKQLLGMALCAIALFVTGFLVGAVDATRAHIGDYGRGYDAGVVAATRPTPETKVVGNMLCKYAEVACVRGGK